MNIFELAALAAATLWALSNVISPKPAKHLGAFNFSRWRMSIVFVMLAVWVAYSGSWKTISYEHLLLLSISGWVGIFLGDTALFAAMNALGPRRASILYSMNAAISTVIGWFWLEEVLSLMEVAGIVTVLIGVVLAIAFGKRKSQIHAWEAINGPLWIGVSFGFGSALFQSIGAIIARPIMETGIDPIAVSALRVGVAAFCLNIFMLLPIKAVQGNSMNIKIFGLTTLSGFVAMALGMTVFLYALSGAEVGIVSTLSAATPAIVLPLIWLNTKEVPAPMAWLGALLVVGGTAMIFAG